MKPFSHFPFHFENQFSPLACKLRKVWAAVESEAPATNLDVLLFATRSQGYSPGHFPHYCFNSNRLTVDFTRGYEVTLDQLVLGLGMHHFRRLYAEGVRNPYAEVWSEAEAWAKVYLASLETDVWPCAMPPTAPRPKRSFPDRRKRRSQQRGPALPPTPLRCVAFLYGGAPCPEAREPGQAFCRGHQHYRLHDLGDIIAGLGDRP